MRYGSEESARAGGLGLAGLVCAFISVVQRSYRYLYPQVYTAFISNVTGLGPLHCEQLLPINSSFPLSIPVWGG